MSRGTISAPAIQHGEVCFGLRGRGSFSRLELSVASMSGDEKISISWRTSWRLNLDRNVSSGRESRDCELLGACEMFVRRARSSQNSIAEIGARSLGPKRSAWEARQTHTDLDVVLASQ